MRQRDTHPLRRRLHPPYAGRPAARRAAADLRARRGGDRAGGPRVPGPDHPHRPDQLPEGARRERRRGGDAPQPPAVRDPGHPRRPAARSRHRRGDDADLRDVDLRAGVARRAQGLRVLAQPEPDALRARASAGRPGERDQGPGVRLGPGGDRHGAGYAERRRPRDRQRRPLRRHLTACSSGCAGARPGSTSASSTCATWRRSRRRSRPGRG